MRTLIGILALLVTFGLSLATPGNGNGNGNGNVRNGGGTPPGGGGPPARRGRCDPTGVDAADIANTQAAIAANCDCAGAADHGDFVVCAVRQAQALLPTRSCRGKVISCAANSTCGIPGAVLCCTTDATGELDCDVIDGGCAACLPPDGGSACCSDPAAGGPTSCCGDSGVVKGAACTESTCTAVP